MQILQKLIKPKNPAKTLYFPRHASTLSPPQQPPYRTPPSSLFDEETHEAGKSKNYRRLQNILVRRINEGCLATNDTFSFLCKSQSTVEMLDELFNCLAELPAGPPRKNACDAFVRRLCKIGLFDNALNVLDEMRERKLELNAFSFRPVFETLVRDGEVEEMGRLLSVIKEFGVKLDSSSFNYALRGYCDKGDVIRALDLLWKMVNEEKLKGDSWTYDAMVLGACRAGKVDGAVAVMREAINAKVKLVHTTYKYVIRALLEDGYYEHAVKFVMVFVGKDKRLDDDIFDYLAIGLMMHERLDEAKMVVDEMSKRGLAMGEKLREFHEKNVK